MHDTETTSAGVGSPAPAPGVALPLRDEAGEIRIALAPEILLTLARANGATVAYALTEFELEELGEGRFPDKLSFEIRNCQRPGDAPLSRADGRLIAGAAREAVALRRRLAEGEILAAAAPAGPDGPPFDEADAVPLDTETAGLTAPGEEGPEAAPPAADPEARTEGAPTADQPSTAPTAAGTAEAGSAGGRGTVVAGATPESPAGAPPRVTKVVVLLQRLKGDGDGHLAVFAVEAEGCDPFMRTAEVHDAAAAAAHLPAVIAAAEGLWQAARRYPAAPAASVGGRIATPARASAPAKTTPARGPDTGKGGGEGASKGAKQAAPALSGDAGALAAAIERYLADGELRTRLRDAARGSVERFAPEKVYARLEEIVTAAAA